MLGHSVGLRKSRGRERRPERSMAQLRAPPRFPRPPEDCGPRRRSLSAKRVRHPVPTCESSAYVRRVAPGAMAHGTRRPAWVRLGPCDDHPYMDWQAATRALRDIDPTRSTTASGALVGLGPGIDCTADRLHRWSTDLADDAASITVCTAESANLCATVQGYILILKHTDVRT